MNKYLGIEIGGTKQQIGIGTEKGEILYSESVKLQYREGAADILEWIQDRTWKLLENYPDICRIGVGFGALWRVPPAVSFVLSRYRVGKISG